jgi:hypothetical protein
MSSTGWAVALFPLVFLLCCLGLYPAALLLASRKPATRTSRDPTARPPAHVSVVITCHNEAAELAGALAALLSQSWSAAPQIIVASDASSDATDAIAVAHEASGVTLFRQDPRAGKTAVENRLIAMVTGDVVFFMDAASRPAPDAMAIMLRGFEDAHVGVVSSRDATRDPDCGGAVSGAEASYLSHEMWLRDLESRAGGIVGASGSLYAIRRELFIELAPHTTRDFGSVLLAQHRGLKAVSAPAHCVVRPALNLKGEHRRRSRTMTQGMATLLQYRGWLHPLDHPGFTIKLWCHKVARWLVMPAALLGVILVAVGSTAADGNLAFLAWSAGVLAGIAMVESVLVSRGHLAVPWLSSAALAALAVLVSWTRLIAGLRTVSWEPTRR